MLSTQNSLYRGLNTVTDKINATGFTWLQVGFCLLSLGAIMPSQAVTIDIGSGSRQWFGPAISAEFTAPPFSQFLTNLDPTYAFIGISNSVNCYNNTQMTDINGIQALKIAQGVFVVPRTTFTISYKLDNGAQETMSGSLGEPETKGIISGNGANFLAAQVTDSAWCLTPRSSLVSNFFQVGSERSASVTGDWIIITDGTQQDGIYTVPSMSFRSRVIAPSNNASAYLSSFQIKVSTRQCSININNSIDFGEVEHNSTIRTELGRVNDNLEVGCTQSSVNPSANINVKFQSNSGFFDGEATRLPLNEGGGYITGEITGIAGVDNGACNSTGGLKFNSDPIRLGSIGTGAGNVSFPNELTWRLCSGGSTLPVGNVSASATVDVIFN
ncbi:adhesin [Serratia sp. T13T92]|uniref:adhesin n=1 Tax=Serratia sp. T13T92 TaxID=3397496 RepID=UPI0039E0A944